MKSDVVPYRFSPAPGAAAALTDRVGTAKAIDGMRLRELRWLSEKGLGLRFPLFCTNRSTWRSGESPFADENTILWISYISGPTLD